MKILKMCKDIAGRTPHTVDVKGFMEEVRDNCDDDKSFFNLAIQYLGGRRYNEFLDYELMAIRVGMIIDISPVCHTDKIYKNLLSAIEALIFDDRHDLYQNLPGALDEVEKTLVDRGKQDVIDKMWKHLATSLIDSINVYGTGNVLHKTTIPE